MEKFSLELDEEKTKIISFGRFKGTKESFDFLGFTFSNGKIRKRYYSVQVSTSKKKLKVKSQAVKEWLRERMHKPIGETMKLLNLKLQGHCNYYEVNWNLKAIRSFYNYVKNRFLRTMRRVRRTDSHGRNWNAYGSISLHQHR